MSGVRPAAGRQASPPGTVHDGDEEIALDRLAAHLERRYGLDVRGVIELDRGVFRIELAGRPDWIARVFPAERPRAAVEGDAALLARLARAGFPAERCAHDEPVSALEGWNVLVTEFVAGTRSRGGKRAFAVLGVLLGRLHAATAEARGPMRSGGGWHHVTAQGGPGEELAGARALLESARTRSAGRERARLDALRAELEQADDCAGLPQALLHPDFVPANAIVTRDERLVVVDWTGAGRGPRLWTLAFLLWAAGARDPELLDAAASRYAAHVTLGHDELERLAGAMRARPLVLAYYRHCVQGVPLAPVLEAVAETRERVETLARRARETLAAPAGRGEHSR